MRYIKLKVKFRLVYVFEIATSIDLSIKKQHLIQEKLEEDNKISIIAWENSHNKEFPNKKLTNWCKKI